MVKAANWLNHLEFDLASPLWRPWFQALSEDHRLVRYDGRGCGLSDWTAQDYSLDGWIRDLEAVVDALNLDRFPLLGISQGGPVAIAYAARHPDRVTHLVLYGTYLRGWARRGLSPEELAEFEALITLTERGWGRDVPTYREIFTHTFIPEANDEQRNWFNDLQRITTSPENAVRLQRAVGAVDVTSLAPAVKCPTLVLHARGDLRCPFDEGRLVAASIAGSRFVSLDSRNHLLLEQEPAWQVFLNEARIFLGVPDRGADGRQPAQGRAPAATAHSRPRIFGVQNSPSLLQDLKQRQIVQWGLLYLAGAWLALQVLDVLKEPWHVPDLALRATQLLVGLGFVLALVIAWYHGEKGRQRVTAPELLVIATLLMIAALLFRLLLS